MKFIKKFDTEANVQVSSKPNVVLVEDTGKVLYNVEIANGAYIQHINGNFFTIDEWKLLIDDNDKANGVVVIDDNARFVIAKSDIGRYYWGPKASTANVTNATTLAAAEANYNGVANTNAMMIAYPNNTSYAAYNCTNFVFPNGNNGYVPALGEWAIVHDNKDIINSALELIGGNALAGGYWSSTQGASTGRAWYFDFDKTEPANHANKDNLSNVRPFMAI